MSRLVFLLAQTLKGHRPALLRAAALSVGLTCCAEAGTDESYEPEVTLRDAAAGGSAPFTPSDGATGPVQSLPDSGSTLGPTDAGAIVRDAGLPSDAGASSYDSGMSLPMGRDAGGALDLGGILDGLGGLLDGDNKDGGAASGSSDGDAGFTPPSTDGGEWTLDDGSFVDCPAEPPPIPIVGGLCAGVYFFCTWTNESGQKYTCTCDWVHWLCL